MPQFNSYTYIVAAIEADILAVWPTVQKVYHGHPKVLVGKGKPYAVISLEPENPVPQSPSGQGMMQNPQFRITKVEPLPPDKSVGVLDRMVSDANLLIARLERSHLYATQGDGTHKAQDPWANLGALEEPVSEHEQVFIVNVNFEVSVRELHTSKV